MIVDRMIDDCGSGEVNRLERLLIVDRMIDDCGEYRRWRNTKHSTDKLGIQKATPK